jgi:hypothetical protein
MDIYKVETADDLKNIMLEISNNLKIGCFHEIKLNTSKNIYEIGYHIKQQNELNESIISFEDMCKNVYNLIIDGREENKKIIYKFNKEHIYETFILIEFIRKL